MSNFGEVQPVRGSSSALQNAGIAAVAVVLSAGYLISDMPYAAEGRSLLSGVSALEEAHARYYQKSQMTRAECVAGLSTQTKLGQMIMLGMGASQLDNPGTRASYTTMLQKNAIGGVILMAEPHSPSTILSLRRNMTTHGIQPFIATDEEGGAVQRFKGLGVLSSEQQIAANNSPTAARHIIAAHAALLNKQGVNVIFGPDVDVAPVSGVTGLPGRGRIFSENPAVVTEYGQAYVDGLKDAGVMPVIKHFPGHGSASGDTHVGLATTPPFSALQKRDLVPFEVIASQSGVSVMIGHLIVPGLTKGRPASLSQSAQQVLRTDMGSRSGNNLVFSDDMGMQGALGAAGSLSNAVVGTIKAGSDVAIVVRDGVPTPAEVSSIMGALNAGVANGSLPIKQVNASVGRILAAKGVNACSLYSTAKAS